MIAVNWAIAVLGMGIGASSAAFGCRESSLKPLEVTAYILLPTVLEIPCAPAPASNYNQPRLEQEKEP